MQASFEGTPKSLENLEEEYKTRQRAYAKLRLKEQEIEATMERIYFVRYTGEGERVITEVKNLLGELNRLQEELATIRMNNLQKFCASLALLDVDISDHDTTNHLNVRASITPTVSPRGSVQGPSQDDFASKTPGQKWRSLFRMLQDLQVQKQVEEAKKSTQSMSVNQSLEDEKGKLRAAIYSLKQKKELSPTDENLLEVLQGKLKGLNNLELVG